MAASKINKEDAQEWLESLQQVGEGWWRQVALAVRAGAHKALGMERREFAQTIGQRMIDPREAIIELYREGHSLTAIQDVLGVSHHRVSLVLAEEGLIEITPSIQRQIDAGKISGGRLYGETPAPESDSTEETPAPESDSELQAQIDELLAEVEGLTANIQGEKAKREREVKALREKISDYQQRLRDQEREAREEAEAGLTEQERERARKEADAWANEQGQKILASLAHLVVDRVVGALEEATEGIQELVKRGAIRADALGRIDTANAAFTEELQVARMSLQFDDEKGR